MTTKTPVPIAICRGVRLIDTPIGRLRASATPAGLRSLSFEDGDEAGDRSPDRSHAPEASRNLDEVEAELEAYFAGRLDRFTVRLNLCGPAFHMRVWRALLEIPFGQTVSYGELARALGAPGSQRAVGAANGANPVAIIVPCHRVVASDGSLHGYAGGLWRKRWLLDHERGQRTLTDR